MDEKWKQIEQELEKAKKKTDEKFIKILKPVERLYSSYRGVISDDFVRDAELSFDDSVEWCTNDWYEECQKNVDIKCVFPQMVQAGLMNEDGAKDINEPNFAETLKMLTAIVSDLFSLKKRLKILAQAVYKSFVQLLPSEKDLQQKAYQQIIKYVLNL